MTAIAYLILFTALVTLGITFFGSVSMARGGEFDDRHSTSLMGARVLVQAVAIGLLIIAAVFWV